jgi:outer membrane protein assembly factor BamA
MPEDKILLNYSYFRLYQAVMIRIKNHWFYGMGYQLDYHFNMNETLIYQNGGDVLSKIEPAVSSGMTINLLSDNRHNSINPKGGYYFTSFYRINQQFLGSTSNWQSLYLDYRKYFKVGKKTNILALSTFGWFTFAGSPPYLDNPAIGWDAYSRSGRGYGQGRYRGAEMLYAESEFRFNLTCNGLLGAVLFTNLSTYSEPQTNNFTHLLPAAGTGLRIKINKFSRTNFAIDVGKGLYDQWNIWLNIGEVF